MSEGAFFLQNIPLSRGLFIEVRPRVRTERSAEAVAAAAVRSSGRTKSGNENLIIGMIIMI